MGGICFGNPLWGVRKRTAKEEYLIDIEENTIERGRTRETAKRSRNRNQAMKNRRLNKKEIEELWKKGPNHTKGVNSKDHAEKRTMGAKHKGDMMKWGFCRAKELWRKS